MTNKQILENNKLIVEFISDEPEVLKRDLLKAGTLESLHYHDSWDWLMPVVEKIEEIESKSTKCEGVIYYEYDVIIRQHSCEIEAAEIHMGGFHSKIEATYAAVIAFIEQYNKDK